MALRGSFCGFGALAAALAFAPGALAQTASPEDVASARALGTEGVHLADAGDCPNAIAKLAAAEKLFHAPPTLERLGECEIQVGKIVAGTERLNLVVHEAPAAGGPAAFVAARARAQKVLAAALPRIGRLRLHVEGAPPDSVTAMVDDVPMPSALFDSARPTDPGQHAVTASAPGFKSSTIVVTVPDGGEVAAGLRLEPLPPAPVAVAAPATAPAAAPPPLPGAAVTVTATAAPPPGGGSSLAPAFTALVVGGVGLAVGTVFGVIAIGDKSTLDGECGATKKACTSQSDVSALDTNSWVANIGFGVGVVGLAIAGVLFATHHGPEQAASTSLWIAPVVGLGTAGIEGTFQ
jgi:hypothetical protein